MMLFFYGCCLAQEKVNLNEIISSEIDTAYVAMDKLNALEVFVWYLEQEGYFLEQCDEECIRGYKGKKISIRSTGEIFTHYDKKIEFYFKQKI